MTLQNDDFFFILDQLMGHSLIELFHLSNLLQMLNGHRMVGVEFFGNFWCNFKRISFDDCSQLIVVNFLWLAIALLIFKGLISFAKLLEPPLHYMLAVLGPNVLLILQVVCLALQAILNSNRKIAWIWFLNKIIFVV